MLRYIRPMKIIILPYLLFILSSLGYPAWAESSGLTIPDVNVMRSGGHWVSDWVDFEVPTGLVNFQIVAVGSPETMVQITDLIDSKGIAYVQSDLDPKQLTEYSRPFFRNLLSSVRSEGVMPGTGTLIVPNTPSLPRPTPGRWKIRAYFHSEPKQKHFTFIFKWNFERTTQTQKQLNLKFWLGKGSYWTKNPSELEALIAQTRNIWRSIGIKFNVQSVSQLPEEIVFPFRPPQDIADIARRVNDPNSINVYFMPKMELQSKAINGLSCIGGPTEIQISHSCSVSLYGREDAASISIDQQAKILAHELGHYLGLFHTVDGGYMMNGLIFDPFSDTSESVTGLNMMDPGIHRGSPQFSPMQVKFLLNSPALNFH
jgi:hypothetical protein